MKLVLPYPPSVNAYWRAVNGRVLLSREGRNYKRRAAIAALASGIHRLPLDVPVVVGIAVFRPRRIGDLDNTCKAILDALAGVAYVNDSQIVEIHARRYDDKANPRAEVTIEVERAH